MPLDIDFREKLQASFKQIDSFGSELRRDRTDSPLTIAEDEKLWHRVTAELEDFFNSIPDLPTYPVFSENLSNIVPGVVNLINRVLLSYDSNSDADSEPKSIKTLLFLDRSARPASFLFRVVWDELKKQGKIAADVEKPRIRFINAGLGESSKHNSTRSLTLLREAFSEREMNDGSVLAVDEFVSSGGSVRRASKTIYDLYGITVPAVANFSSLPRWYSQPKHVKGVEDQLFSEEFVDAIDHLPENRYETLRQKAKEMDRSPESLADFRKSLPRSIKKEMPKKETSEYVLKFFRTRGGLLSSPAISNKEHYRLFLKHRLYLKKMGVLMTKLIEKV